jgi:hypothetical protein
MKDTSQVDVGETLRFWKVVVGKVDEAVREGRHVAAIDPAEFGADNKA